jgi:hypothetical protein
MNLHLHIDRVVIDGPAGGPRDVDSAELEAALTSALTERLDHTAPQAADEAIRRGPDLDLRHGGPVAEAIGRAVAKAVVPGGDR